MWAGLPDGKRAKGALIESCRIVNRRQDRAAAAEQISQWQDRAKVGRLEAVDHVEAFDQAPLAAHALVKRRRWQRDKEPGHRPGNSGPFDESDLAVEDVGAVGIEADDEA